MRVTRYWLMDYLCWLDIAFDVTVQSILNKLLDQLENSRNAFGFQLIHVIELWL